MPLKNKLILAVLFSVALLPAKGQSRIPLDENYAIDFYKLYFSRDLNGTAANYLQVVKADTDLSRKFDIRIDEFQEARRVKFSLSLSSGLKSQFFAFYAFLTFDRDSIASFCGRQPDPDQAITEAGLGALDNYLSGIGDKPASLQNQWLGHLGINQDTFYRFLEKINIGRPHGGFKTPDFKSYSKDYYQEQLSLITNYAQLEVSSVPAQALITIAGVNMDVTTTNSVVWVPINGDSWVAIVTVSKDGYKSAILTKTVYANRQTAFSATLQKN